MCSDYPFSVEDSVHNLRFESDGFVKKAGPPVIKGGTLVKLVERLTFPQYADLHFLRHFLTTYRSFCTSEEFLQTLIQRYRIPEPKQLDKVSIKHFNKNYVTPVKIRLVPVASRWPPYYCNFAVKGRRRQFLQSTVLLLDMPRARGKREERKARNRAPWVRNPPPPFLTDTFAYVHGTWTV